MWSISPRSWVNVAVQASHRQATVSSSTMGSSTGMSAVGEPARDIDWPHSSPSSSEETEDVETEGARDESGGETLTCSDMATGTKH
jgi:hypothetical protein